MVCVCVGCMFAVCISGVYVWGVYKWHVYMCGMFMCGVCISGMCTHVYMVVCVCMHMSSSFPGTFLPCIAIVFLCLPAPMSPPSCCFGFVVF